MLTTSLNYGVNPDFCLVPRCRVSPAGKKRNDRIRSERSQRHQPAGNSGIMLLSCRFVQKSEGTERQYRRMDHFPLAENLHFAHYYREAAEKRSIAPILFSSADTN
jgi:hypothetical protein